MSALPLLPLGDEDEIAYKEVTPDKLKRVKTLFSQSRGNNIWGDDMWWWLKDMPVGKLDEASYLTFTSGAVPVRKSENTRAHDEY